MSERVVDKLLQNAKEDKFTLIMANGSQTECSGDQLKPKLTSNDSIDHLEEDLRETMRDMQYANFTYLWIDDGNDHDVSLHQNYYNQFKTVDDFEESLKLNEGN